MFRGKNKGSNFPLGITWVEDEIVIAKLVSNGNKFLAETLKFPLEGVFNVEGELVDPEGFIKFLQKLNREMNWHSKKVVSAFPGRQASLRLLKLPRMPKQELKQAVEWEAKQSHGLTKKEYCLDYIALEDETDKIATMKRVLLAAIPKENAMKLYRVFSDGGFKLEAIDVAPLAFTRALINNASFINTGQEDASLFIDLDYGLTQLIFYSCGQIIFARTINFNSFAPSSTVDMLANEIKRTLNYLKIADFEKTLQEIVVGGMGVDWVGLGELEKELEVKIKKAKPGLGFLSEPYPEPMFTTALGLALKGVAGNVH